MLLLPRLGARVLLCGPEELLPEWRPAGPGIEIERDFDAALRQSQAVMMLRIQAERWPGCNSIWRVQGQLPAHRATAGAQAPEAIVMHPGPIIRGLEVTAGVADGPQSVDPRTGANGVAIRMAVVERR
jgi:aspartate carbamoyltransferase catalytic subunit